MIQEKITVNLPSTSKDMALCETRILSSTDMPFLMGRNSGKNHDESCSSSVSYLQSLKCASIDDSDGVRMSGTVTVYFHTTKSKKSYFAVLKGRTFELHESEKTVRKKKSAKYIVNLSICLNVSQQMFGKFGECVSLMSPDETLIFRSKKRQDTEKWYENALSALIPSRAIHLGRPVLPTEFFESAWDVILKSNPKLKNLRTGSDNLPNICELRPELVNQKRRLCIYPHALLLCQCGIGPNGKGMSPTVIPPLAAGQFIEFSRGYLKDFGSHDKYFFLRFGRSVELDPCELWLQCAQPPCDLEEAALEIYRKVKEVIERENRKQRMLAEELLLTHNSAPSSNSARNHNSRRHNTLGFNSLRKHKTTRSTKNEKAIVGNSTVTFNSDSYDRQSASHDSYRGLNHKHLKRSMGDFHIDYDDCQNRSHNISGCYCHELANSQLIVKPVDYRDGGVDEETEDSGGTLRVSCDLCRVESLATTTHDETASHCSSSENSTQQCRTNISPNIADSRKCPNEEQQRKRNEAKIEVCYKGPKKLRKSLSMCFEIAKNNNIIHRTTNTKKTLLAARKFYSMFCLNELEAYFSKESLNKNISNSKPPCAANTVVDTNSCPESGLGECSSENMSTSSSISASATQFSSFLSEDACSSTSSQQGSCGIYHYQQMPYHARTMSCSAHASNTNSNSSENEARETDIFLAENAARFAYYRMQKERKKIIADEKNPQSFGCEVTESSMGSILDQASCSSSTGSVPFLSVPRQYCNNLPNYCVDDICSYASDSADSCYSSITNDLLDPRTLSFSSTTSKPVVYCCNDYSTVTEKDMVDNIVHHHHYHQQNHHYPLLCKRFHEEVKSDNVIDGSLSPRYNNPLKVHPPQAQISPQQSRRKQTSYNDQDEIQVLSSVIVEESNTTNLLPADLSASASGTPANDARQRTLSLGNTSWLARKLFPKRKTSTNLNDRIATSKSDRAILSSEMRGGCVGDNRSRNGGGSTTMLGDVAFTSAWASACASSLNSSRSKSGPVSMGQRRLSWRSTEGQLHTSAHFALLASQHGSSSGNTISASNSSIVRADSVGSNSGHQTLGGRVSRQGASSLAGFSLCSDSLSISLASSELSEQNKNRHERHLDQKAHPSSCVLFTEEENLLLDSLFIQDQNENRAEEKRKTRKSAKSKATGTSAKLKPTKKRVTVNGGKLINSMVVSTGSFGFETIAESASGRNSPFLNNNNDNNNIANDNGSTDGGKQRKAKANLAKTPS